MPKPDEKKRLATAIVFTEPPDELKYINTLFPIALWLISTFAFLMMDGKESDNCDTWPDNLDPTNQKKAITKSTFMVIEIPTLNLGGQWRYFFKIPAMP